MSSAAVSFTRCMPAAEDIRPPQTIFRWLKPFKFNENSCAATAYCDKLLSLGFLQAEDLVSRLPFPFLGKPVDSFETLHDVAFDDNLSTTFDTSV